MSSLALPLTLVAALACSAPAGQASPSTAARDAAHASAASDALAARVDSVADSYVADLLTTFPEFATSRGIPGARHDRLTDNSLAAYERWQRREDRWLAELRAIDPTPLQGRPAWATYAILRERLEGSVEHRVCHTELWNLNTAQGWQAGYAVLARLQPVGSDSLRAQALTRARALPRHIATEESNLRKGVHRGYTAPKVVVEGVIRQLDALLATAPDASPFASPAQRDSTPAFRQAMVGIVAEQIDPALRRFRDYLSAEYLPAARSAIGVSANPDGAACYRASVRQFSTLDLPPDSVFERGMRKLAEIEDEMRTVAERNFGTSDLPALLTRLRDDPEFTFRTREEIVDSSRAAIERARAAIPKWFGILPKAHVVIEQHPEFRQRAGAVAQYNPPAQDGSRPGIFYITTIHPEHQSRALLESTAFHEAIPGHHLQITIAQERAGSNPVARYIFNSGFTEGWALYAEGLADEMGLYGSELGRLGMLSSAEFRAARLVLDSGIHTRGWTRDQAIEFLTRHSAEPPLQVRGEIDRYISWPGQATSYMLGNLEIRALRNEAKQRLGSRFDIRAFHDQVLGGGALPLPRLREKIERWLNQPAT
ncbi:MAG TPA: DUF885 domain-containing protein [Gemmatimonadales bacterium]|nr:DUF885 domain-containing protein [Gemmatimonadales bacterium]